MSKQINNESTFWEMGIALSAEKKVFITSGPTTHCSEIIAAGAKELVCLNEECSVEGVKTRNNYKERPNSKDLLIDVSGDLPIDEAERLLKKFGVVISLVNREWGEYFNHVCPVVWSAPQELEDGKVIQSLEYGDHSGEPLFWIAASHLLPTLPEISRPVAPVSEDTIALKAAQDEIAELREQLKKADRAKRSSQTRASNLKITLDAQSSELDELQEAADALKKETKSLKRKLTIAEKVKIAQAELKEAHEQLNQELESTREALILREGEHAKTTASLKRIEKSKAEITDELNTLKSSHRSLNEQHTQTQRKLALAAENTEKLSSSEARLEETQEAFNWVAKSWSEWLGRGLDEELPPIPSPRLTLVQSWSQQLITTQPLVKGTLDEHRELIALRAELDALNLNLAEASEQRDQARTEAAALRERLGVSDETLVDSLNAERALRKAQEAELEATYGQLETQRAQMNTLYTELDETKKMLSARELEAVAGDPRVHQLEAQLKIQRQQRAARERLLTVHHELQVQLTTALEEEISARAELERRLEEAERELRELRVERDFPRARREERPRHEERSRHETRPHRDDSSRREASPPPRARAERLSSLSAQLKSSADDQRYQLESAQSQGHESKAPEAKLNKSTKKDQNRVRTQAKLLKEKYAVTEGTRAAASAQTPQTQAPTRPSLSTEELNEQAQRAQSILKDRLKKLSRTRR